MANIKSAKKRILQNHARSEINKSRKSKVRGAIKNINILLSKKDFDKAKKEFLFFESNIAKAASKGFFKRNTASRLVSRMAKKIKISA
tara:strand:- start:410 stop:673 length:264 start_codon:yes stop_codon:yes gene_type:complete